MEQEYTAQLIKLLPPGPAWQRPIDSRFCKILAKYLNRLELYFFGLHQHNHPTVISWERWEKVLAVPDECFDELISIASAVRLQRRHRVPHGVATIAALQADIDAAGLTATIKTTGPAKVTIEYDSQIEIVYLAVDDPVDQPLAQWGDTQLECFFDKIKPAHILAKYAIVANSPDNQ